MTDIDRSLMVTWRGHDPETFHREGTLFTRAALILRATAAAICLVLSSACSLLPDEVPPFTDAIRLEAYEYVKSLPQQQPIYVWASRYRAYSALFLAKRIVMYMDNYFAEADAVQLGTPFDDHVGSVTVFYIDDRGLNKSALARSTTGDRWVFESVVSMSTGDSPTCDAALKTGDRFIELAVGVVRMDMSSSLENRDEIRDCTFRILDYSLGFPTNGGGFRNDVPQHQVRLAVMWAFRECSRSRHLIDTTASRDGMTPFPSIGCALKFLS